MGATQLTMLKLLLLLTITEICAAENDMTFSVFTLTSKSITVEWIGPPGANSYKITATPKNSSKDPVFAQFSGYAVMGSLNSLSPNTLYTVQIEAMDNALNVLSSARLEDTTAPEVPTITQAYSKKSDSITVEFSEVSGATSYILRAESGDFFYETTVNSTPGTVVHLQPLTNYMLSVMSVNSGGRSQPSLSVEAMTVVVAPQMNTTSPNNDTILVSWPAVEHAVFYTLCIIQEGSNTRLKVNTTDTMMTFDGLEAGTRYCIKGMAWDADGRTGDDLTVCQITRPTTPDVTSVQVTQGRFQGIVVYWLPVQGAESYIAVNSDGENCTSTIHNFCYILKVDCGQNNSLTVTATNDGGPSEPSDPKAYLTYPCPPENIWVEEPEAGNCSLVWDEVQHVEHYIAFMKRDDGKEDSCNTTKTSCHFFCMCGHTYLTTVFPYNQAGPSLSSHVRNYTTIPCCPQNVTVKLVSTETLEVMWSPVIGAELYQTTAAETNNVVHCNDSAPVCALSDLRCNTAYSVTVTPCSESGGCNQTCTPHTRKTAPCSPEILNMTQTNNATYWVQITTPNMPNTNYTITATGRYDTHTCHTGNSSCELTQLPCGSIYEVTAVATTAEGRSLPGYSKTLETGPCCPNFVNVTQVTMAMTNVTWSPGKGARSYITSLTSSKGHAKCHTMDTHCLMGCITCSTNYRIHLEAISSTGHKSECQFRGFSSSPCCPTGIKLYRMGNNTLRVNWRPVGPQIHNHSVEFYGTGANYTCMAAAGSTHCDIQEDSCGDVYAVMVAPVTQNRVKVHFCQPRKYSLPCSGSNAVISRGRRSLD